MCTKAKQAKTSSSFWPLATEAVSNLKQVCGISSYPWRNSMEKHDATWYIGAQRHPTHARSGMTKAARISRRLPGWLPGMNQCGISWWKSSCKNRAMPESCITCLCCELSFGCKMCSLWTYCTPFCAEAELWNVNTDVDLFSILEGLTSCPLPPITSVPLANLGRVEKSSSFKPSIIEPSPSQARNSWRTYHYYGKSLSIIASSYFVAVYTSVSKTLYQCSVSVCTHWLMRLSPTPPYSTISCQPLFDFQALELCSHLKPCQRPKKNSWSGHLHTSLMTLKFWCFLSSWRSFSPHKSHLQRGGRTWHSDSNWNCTWTWTYWKNKTAQRATLQS